MMANKGKSEVQALWHGLCLKERIVFQCTEEEWRAGVTKDSLVGKEVDTYGKESGYRVYTRG